MFTRSRSLCLRASTIRLPTAARPSRRAFMTKPRNLCGVTPVSSSVTSTSCLRWPTTPTGATRLGGGFPARQCPTRAECVRTMLHRIRWTDFCSDQSRRFIFTAPSRAANFVRPLPVFVRGGELRHRVEPDFVIFYRNQVLVLELDGKQFHPETAAEADARLALLEREGAYVEHISSAECDTAEKAETIAKQIIALLEKLVANK